MYQSAGPIASLVERVGVFFPKKWTSAPVPTLKIHKQTFFLCFNQKFFIHYKFTFTWHVALHCLQSMVGFLLHANVSEMLILHSPAYMYKFWLTQHHQSADSVPALCFLFGEPMQGFICHVKTQFCVNWKAALSSFINLYLSSGTNGICLYDLQLKKPPYLSCTWLFMQTVLDPVPLRPPLKCLIQQNHETNYSNMISQLLSHSLLLIYIQTKLIENVTMDRASNTPRNATKKGSKNQNGWTLMRNALKAESSSNEA